MVFSQPLRVYGLGLLAQGFEYDPQVSCVCGSGYLLKSERMFV